MDSYSRQQLCAAADVDSTVMDYWCKKGLLCPSGPARSYTAREMSIGLVLAKAAHLGAPGSALANLVEALDGPPHSWPSVLHVLADGQVTVDEVDACWLVRPRQVLVHAGPNMLLALAS